MKVSQVKQSVKDIADKIGKFFIQTIVYSFSNANVKSFTGGPRFLLGHKGRILEVPTLDK